MMHSRRSFIARIGLIGAAGVLRADADVASPPTAAQREAIGKIAGDFMGRFKAPGLAVAFARDGRLVLEQGFGSADKVAGAPVTPRSLFRIASVSKPITAAAIFSLIEQGRLAPGDLVFGEKGRLGFDYGRELSARVKAITVHHLLTHTAGGWGNSGADPMFQRPAADHRTLIEWTLANQPLTSDPGAAYAYSNFGYCVLGRLIEKVTALPYAQAVQRDVLGKCGVTAMRIAGNTLIERAPGEVVYYSDGKGNPYGMNVARMDAHGGWIATAGDLVRFAMRVDGFPNPPDILRAETLKAMTTPPTAEGGYACGWAVNKVPNWWHNGSLPGTSSILVRTASGMCWAALVNTRTEGIGPALDRMMWEMARAVPEWRA